MRMGELQTFNSQSLDLLRLPGDQEIDLIHELTRTLFATTEERVEKIRALVAQGRWRDAAVEAHSLKSTARTMGGERMGEMCFFLEEELKKTPVTIETGPFCDEVLREYRKFAAELAVYTGIRFADATA